jgi:hypothetical protein
MFKYSLAVLLTCVVAALAEAQTTFEWDFKKNDKFVVETQTANMQHVWFVEPVLTAEGAAQQVGTLMACGTQTPLHCLPLQFLGNRLVKADQRLEHAARYRIEVKQTDKGLVLKQTIDDCRLVLAGTATGQSLGEKLRTHPCTITLGPSFDIVSFEGYEDLVKAVIEGVPEKDRDKEASRFRTILSEESMKATIRELFAMLPPKPVETGDTWKSPETVEGVPGIGEVRRKSMFKYVGKEPRRIDGKEQLLAHIVHNSSVSFTNLAPTEGSEGSGGSAAPALPFKIVHADIRVDKARGEMLFDLEKGRPVVMTAEMQVNGLVSVQLLESGEQSDLLSFVNQLITRTITIRDVPPDNPKP